MRDGQPKTTYLKDYQPPVFLIEQTDLTFDLMDEYTEVRSKLLLQRNQHAQADTNVLVLDGVELNLLSLAIDGRELSEQDYRVEADSLTIPDVPSRFELSCVTRIQPQLNTSLEGLYKSSAMYCTQCEAEGFRKITYYLDRPDVMSRFSVTISADRQRFPVLLSNGNRVDAGELADGRHWARWEDPFAKPSYLFALVAGDLQFVEDHFSTVSGRQVCLRIYVEPKDLDKCAYAMQSLIRAMRWDEQKYGREYDLDVFNIVAVDDFNMGAMENKSLNIFNTSCVLANPQTTTDAGFKRVEAVVAHEYFHNWSGNRVTCRDWFQLSLKEGFTVFRDAQFSADMGSATVKRVEDVMFLRTVQFSEDAGPMAHSVRPESYMEISNFYTVTIYEKGAEVVRMLWQMLGEQQFRRASDLYFERHDGQAVTCEDFIRAMEDASGRDLTQFRRWYAQAGTPRLSVRGRYDVDAKRYHLNVRQHCAPSPGQPEKAAFQIPLAVALLGREGPLPLHLSSVGEAPGQPVTELVLEVTEPEQTFVFEQVDEPVVPSLLRGFSAPVQLDFAYSRDQLGRIMRLDNDGFNRWDAAQQLSIQVLQEMIHADKNGSEMVVDPRLIAALRTVLCDDTLDKAMVALMLNLPSEAYLVELSEEADVARICRARMQARKTIARALRKELWHIYKANQNARPYEPSAEQIAQRSLKNTAMAYLMLLEEREVLDACVTQFNAQQNMTDVMASLSALVNSGFSKERERALSTFYKRWKHEALVINQWFMVQAAAAQPDVLEHVRELLAHEAFDIRNPNKVRALVATFAAQNLQAFHRADGEGYRFLADYVMRLDKINPQVAARLVVPLTKWRRFPLASQQQMRAELTQILAQPKLSADVYEIVSKSLAV